MRWLISIAFVLFCLAGVSAQSAPSSTPPEPWQASITAQIQAFRAKDGAAALALAGTAFKATFTDPDVFFATLEASGYAPLLTSRSHSFGTFEKVGSIGVNQIVQLVGPDRTLYRALYQMTEEAEGWRVQGVLMIKEAGVAI